MDPAHTPVPEPLPPPPPPLIGKLPSRMERSSRKGLSNASENMVCEHLQPNPFLYLLLMHFLDPTLDLCYQNPSGPWTREDRS